MQAFVWENDVYVKTSPTAKAIQVTSNGKHNKILNGIPDWVYEGKQYLQEGMNLTYLLL